MYHSQKIYSIYDKRRNTSINDTCDVDLVDEDFSSLASPSSVEYSSEDNLTEEFVNENNWVPDVLVLGPGGIKGTLQLGSLFVLQKEGFLNNIHTYAGVSVGAIISLLIIVGYTIKEIIAITTDTDILQDIENFNILRASNNSGMISSDPIRRKLMSLVTNKIGLVPNLYQLYKDTSLSLVTVSHNITTDEPDYFDPFTRPNMSCVDAVMLSINIPIVFYRLVYDNNVYVDGALGNPYPINYFDNTGLYNILGIYIKNDKRTVRK